MRSRTDAPPASRAARATGAPGCSGGAFLPTAALAALAAALVAPGGAGAAPVEIAVPAAAETGPVAGDADDPAIWIGAGGLVRILGTDKETGLYVWDLAGRELQVFPDGILNNVDLRPFGTGALAAATRRDDDTIAFWRIGADGALARAEPFLHPAAPPALAGEADDVYGLAMAAGARGETFIIVNYKSGHVVQWQVTEAADGRLELAHARSFRLASQPEGMVADDRAGQLYLGEEDAGVWRVALDPLLPAEPESVDRVGSPCLPRDDVEGLAIWDRGVLGRFLVVSAQGIDRAALYDLDAGWPPPCIALLAVPAGGVDGVTETDGLEVTARPLPGFPQGLLVMMDDQNEGFTSNFKLIDWAAVMGALGR